MQQSVDKTQMLLRLGNSSLPHSAAASSNSSSSTITLSTELLVGQIQTTENSNIIIASNINGTDRSAGNRTNNYLFLIEFGAGALGGAVSRTA